MISEELIKLKYPYVPFTIVRNDKIIFILNNDFKTYTCLKQNILLPNFKFELKKFYNSKIFTINKWVNKNNVIKDPYKYFKINKQLVQNFRIKLR